MLPERLLFGQCCHSSVRRSGLQSIGYLPFRRRSDSNGSFSTGRTRTSGQEGSLTMRPQRGARRFGHAVAVLDARLRAPQAGAQGESTTSTSSTLCAPLRCASTGS
jgi:hypothetical protein